LLSEVVDNYTALQGNSRRSHYVALLTGAKWAWKELLAETIWSVRQRYVRVQECANGSRFIRLPKDVLRLLNVNDVDDCGNLRPMSNDPHRATARLALPKPGCTCHCGGHSTLCGELDGMMLRTEPVVLGGQTYTRRLYNRKGDSGELVEIAENPTMVRKPDGTQEVVTTTVRRLVCKLESNTEGCIANTPGNRRLLETHCGCVLIERVCDVRRLDNSWGYWTVDAEDPTKLWVRDNGAAQLIVTYQSDGDREMDEEDGEYLVPEYAAVTLMAGVDHYASMFNPTEAPRNKDDKERRFGRMRRKLVRFLDPIRLDDIANLSARPKKWR
jgi:hypothetical protein